MTISPSNSWLNRLIASVLHVAACLMLATSFQAHAQNGSPMETVETTVTAILEILRNDSIDTDEARTLMRIEIGKSFDARAMSQSVLSTNWRDASKEQQDEFQALFMQTLENTYIGRVEAYTNEQVDFKKEDINNNRATVDTAILASNNEIPVNYKLRLRSDGWFVYDVEVENVSMVSSYRETYRSVVKRDGMDGLLAQMREKAAQVL
ncbi:MAG: ABC transporter substrate-binding protein [Gammaproteobacteria bacterium]|jgi:phospholipid transport system substrate-binding protein|nr:ABC transporter substrate-binding protein [Gammaproteobacteria bacterium]MBT6044056.1 ABC transporter substrate-binding protein [Gammaproteobacteria bacterium]